jgi:CheY-like chemotaxis protein
MVSAPSRPIDTENTSRPRILLAEDDPEMREMLSFVLWREGYAVESITDGASLLQRLDEAGTSEAIDWDLVISDIRMPGITGMEVLEYLKARGNLPPLMLITAFGDEQTHELARRLGAVALLDKPFDLQDLMCQVRQVILPHPEKSDYTLEKPTKYNGG